MERSKAELEADLKLLSQRKVAAKAEAELIALCNRIKKSSQLNIPPDGQ